MKQVKETKKFSKKFKSNLSLLGSGKSGWSGIRTIVLHAGAPWCPTSLLWAQLPPRTEAAELVGPWGGDGAAEARGWRRAITHSESYF